MKRCGRGAPGWHLLRNTTALVLACHHPLAYVSTVHAAAPPYPQTPCFTSHQLHIAIKATPNHHTHLNPTPLHASAVALSPSAPSLPPVSTHTPNTPQLNDNYGKAGHVDWHIGIPPLPEVTLDNLWYDQRDAKRYKEGMLGCPKPIEMFK